MRKTVFYHIYNRGVEKRKIFLDKQDYVVFLGYLRDYLTPKNEGELSNRLSDLKLNPRDREKISKLLKLNNFNGELELLCYCLMPNHFHFLVRQNSERTIDSFTNSLVTRYVMYFNKKYKRVGHLFQDVYKAVMIENEMQLLHLSRYIHRNPLGLESGKDEHQRLFTSLPEYLGQRKTSWIEIETIWSYFSKVDPKNSYFSFVQQTDERERIENLLLEDFEL